MILSVKSVILFIAILLTGLSSGLFYAWTVSVIPGTRKVTDIIYLEAMQSINRAILNPAFMVIFLGSLILLLVSIFQHNQNGVIFWILLAAMLLYLLGTFGVTALGNVPLNNELDVMSLGELSIQQLSAFRNHYEQEWNRLHYIRTVSSVISFLLSLLAAFVR